MVVSQYFWPENFKVNDVVKFLLSKNHTVDVLTAEPNYPDGKLFNKYKENKNVDHFLKFFIIIFIQKIINTARNPATYYAQVCL